MEIKCSSKKPLVSLNKYTTQNYYACLLIDSMIEDIEREMQERSKICFDKSVCLDKSIMAFHELEYLCIFRDYFEDVKEQFQ